LEIKRRRLDRFLLRAIEPDEAGRKGIGNSEFHLAPEPNLKFPQCAQ
jgi:hypothetical protein